MDSCRVKDNHSPQPVQAYPLLISAQLGGSHRSSQASGTESLNVASTPVLRVQHSKNVNVIGRMRHVFIYMPDVPFACILEMMWRSIECAEIHSRARFRVMTAAVNVTVILS